MSEIARTKTRRGFGAMDPAKQRALAVLGGKSVPRSKRTFSQDLELAAAAGRKGGNSVSPKNRAFSTNRNLAVSAGAKGGKATHARRATAAAD